MNILLKKAFSFVNLLIIFPVGSLSAESKISFNPNFLFLSDGDSAKKINLDYFSHSTGSAPGKYTVDVYVNDKLVGKSQSIDFSPINNKLMAKLNPSILEQWGVDTKKIKKNINHNSNDILTTIEGAKEYFNINNRQLRLNIPQYYLKPRDWFSVPPHLWEDGLPAFMVNYQFNEYRTNRGNYTGNSKFLSIESSLNLGGWRLRQSGNWSSNSSREKSHWQPMMLYLQRDYSALQGGQFTLGQTATDSDIFDSFPFEGIQLASDNNMIAGDLNQYSPIVRGIAYSQAEVIIKQNGVVVYQKSVKPGLFEIRDFNAIYSGDLDVEVRETDGSVRHYKQSAASLPVLQREGRFRYNIALGKYRNTNYFSHDNEPYFFLASGAIGLPNEYTFYGGGIQANDYISTLAGIGKYSKILGAISFDITHAVSDFSSNHHVNKSGKESGQSYRFMYSRGFGESNATLNVSGYKYSTKGYYGFNELQNIKSRFISETDISKSHERARIQAQISQDFNNLGMLSLSGSREFYWDTSTGYNFTASYSIPFRHFSTTVSMGISKSPYYDNTDKSLYLTLSMPINSFQSNYRYYITNSMVTSNGDVRQQVSINSVSDDNKFSSNLSQGWQYKSNNKTSNLNLNYRGSYGLLNGSYTYQNDATQFSYGISGGVIVHQNGVTLSQPLSLNSAMALVRAEGAKNIKITNRTIYTDWRGYAVVPNLNIYNKNQVSLDVNTITDDVELLNTDVNVIPSRGALIAADFSVKQGNKALITLLQKNELPVPFGSLVSLANSKESNTSIVADSGQVYISGLPDEGELYVKWGNTAKEECKAKYALSKSKMRYNEITLRCY
ncbi:fimbrial biogenesis outer membrane usher protein [Escherichia coli]|nr:fimbrial biogenesis outer membrane usher protein [Escherichia coli]EKQ4416827.1 fimbrial biogenesis outer membrane usher protein [Escherichia coli]EKQ5207160.1 fimbrial biogenesis outer membrane usher protein [Escherichia coli]EKQ5221514.1 fimbrial biogenesis outer membrane usher protein [Escherichia coli]EMA9088789.1 fimbrial biogenesis outer membrane usher protein [Escherichia coli]